MRLRLQSILSRRDVPPGQEQAMEVASIWPLAAARLHLARMAVAKFCGPLDTDPQARPTAPSEHLQMPFCVSYGRAVFCFHLPKPRDWPEQQVADRSAR
jgi:hypothetical protein